jgi:hypothetical protein
MGCTFDHRAPAFVSRWARDCSGSVTGPCEYPEFYDAANTGLYGISGLDYALIPHAIEELCTNPEGELEYADEFGAARGPDSLCAMSSLHRGTLSWTQAYGTCYRMSCSAEGVLTILVGVESTPIECMVGGTVMTLANFTGHLLCPDPRVVCGILTFQENSTALLPRTHGVATVRPRTPAQSGGPVERTRIATRTAQPEQLINLEDSVEVASTEIRVHLTGTGEIEPTANNSVIVLRELAVDGGTVIATGLEITQRLELLGAASLAPAEGDIIVLESGVEIALIGGEGTLPRLALGVVGGSYAVVPGDIEVEVQGPVTGLPWVLVTADSLNCDSWLGVGRLTAPSGLMLACQGPSGPLVLRASSPGSSLSVSPIPSGTPLAPTPDDSVIFGLTQNEVIMIGAGIVAALGLIGLVVRLCQKKADDDKESELNSSSSSDHKKHKSKRDDQHGSKGHGHRQSRH